MQATYAQEAFDTRVAELKDLDDVEKLVAGKITKSPLGVYQVSSEIDLKPRQGTILKNSLAARTLTEEAAEKKGPTMLKATADGYKPAAGFDMGWVLWTLALDNDQTESIIALVEGGAGVSGVIAAIAALFPAAGVPAAVIAGVAAGAFIIHATHLKVVNRGGGNHGVYWKGANAEVLVPALVAAHSNVFFARYK